jgi:hypothetical protein
MENEKRSFSSFNKIIIKNIKEENIDILICEPREPNKKKVENWNDILNNHSFFFCRKSLYVIMAEYKGEYNERKWGLKSDFYKKLYLDLYNLCSEFEEAIFKQKKILNDEKNDDEEYKGRLKHDNFISYNKIEIIDSLLYQCMEKISSIEKNKINKK